MQTDVMDRHSCPIFGANQRSLPIVILGFFLLVFGTQHVKGAPASERRPLNALSKQQIEAVLEEKASRSLIERKLDSQLLYGLRERRSGQAGLPVWTLRPKLRFLPDQRILVDMRARVSPGLLSALVQGGGTVVVSLKDHETIRAIVPLSLVQTLAVREDVLGIRPADEATTNSGSVASLGDITHRADEARNLYQVDGAGVKVGVLADGAASLPLSQTNGNLPGVTILPGQAGGGDEGTAMLELVHDLAPRAELYFATAFSGVASFAENIRALHAAGCRIIIDDVLYFNESPFQDGPIAQAVNDVSAAGTLFFSSAGNSGNKNDNTSGTWEGDFLDGGPATLGRGGRLHDFGGVTFNTVLAGGEFQRVDLFWSDPLGRSSNDYDVFVLNADGSVASASANIQDGNDDPYEIIPSVDVGQRIVIVKVAGEDRFLYLSTGRGRLELSTPGATHGHNASGATNAFCVAATRVGTPVVPFTGGDGNPVETFSSDGPRHMFYNPDGSPITPGNVSSSGGAVLQKPDLTAADGVATSVFAYSIFYGTSAAAPHAGAIAALLWSYNPLLTPAQVRTLLLESALDIEAPGVDRDSGAGIVMAVPAIEASPAPAPRLFYESNLLVDANGTGTMDVRECAELYVTLNNRIVTSGESATGVRGAISTTTPEVVVDPTPQPFADIASSGGATNLIPFRISTTSGFLCGTPIDLRLAVTTSNAGSYTFAFQLPLSSPGIGASTPFESPDVPRVVPDLSTVASTVTVSGVSLPLAKITVSLHARHTYDSDLALLLVGPDGTEVALSSNRGGSGADYGSGCDQRTVFDDAAATPIASGTWPFLGAFRPEQPLSAFNGKSGDAVNGVWTLRIRDEAPGDSGTLLCWSLQAFPISCLDGGGQCLVPPRFTVEPQDVTVTNVGGAAFTAQVEGSAPLSYQWFFNRTTAVPGATNSTLAFENVTLDMAGTYAVVASNLYGTAMSREAQLDVLSAPLIVGQPQDLLVTNGQSAVFTVAARGTERLSYQWYFDLTNSLANETNAALVLTNASLDNAGLYSVTVTNAFGAAESVAALLTVVVPPFITQQPEPQRVFAGGDATFTVVAGGSAPLEYQWFHQTNALAGATNSTLILVNVTLKDAGGYTVVVSNPFGSITSAAAPLTVLSAPLIVGHPQDLLVTNGQSAGFTVAARGTEPLSYQWYFNLTNVLANETNAALVLTNASLDNAGLYSVTVTNAFGAAESAAALLTVVVPPFITQQPEPQSVFAGSDATFTVIAGGSAPLLYQWFHQTNALAEATNSILSLVNVTLKDAGGYTVVVSNPFGSLTSAAAQLTVLSAPLIVGHPQDLLVTNGQSAGFTVAARGTEPLSYQWYSNLTNVLANETNAALVLTNASIDNGGLYSVTVTNAFGAAESAAALLTVVVPPFITQQPEPQSVFAGSDATFTVIAGGSSPLAYQWFHQTNALAEATNGTLGLVNVALNDAGDYTVVVSNPFGSITSAPVQLTLLSAPQIVGQPQDLLVTNRQSAVFTVTASGAEPLSYQWYFNVTNSLAGETNAALVLTRAETNNAGVYHVTVSNPGGTALSDAATLAVIVPPNVPPTVRWLSPTNGAEYFVIDPIHLVADASDADRAVARVEFFDGPSLLGEATLSPGEGYVFDWVGAAAGGHDLVALATDDEGATNRSNPIRITVSPLPTPQILLVSTGAVWKYLDTGEDPGVSWRTNDFDDGPWLSGPAELGYGDDVEGRPEATVLNFGLDPSNRYPTYYFRRTFQVTNASTISELTLRVLRDDGIVVYLNGKEIFRDNLPEGDVQFTNLAVLPIEGEAETEFIVTNLPPDLLVEGTNLLAVEIHQAAADSPDISFDLELIGAQPGAPIILSMPQDQVVVQGQTARFRVVAASAQTSSAIGPLAYQWYRNGLSPMLGETNATLIIPNTQPENEGTYSVQISNPIASVLSDEAQLRVLVPPQIIRQPEGVSAVRGDTVEFSILATGSPPLRYEWHVNNGAALDGAITNTLVLGDVRQSNAGAYQVVVANDAGSVTSQVATLTLIGGPTILAQPRNATVLTGATVQFDVAAQGIGPLSYQWHLNATNVLSGATNASLVLSNVTLHLSGQYHVLVSDDTGVRPSQPALLRVLPQPGISHLSQTGAVARLVFSSEIGLRYTVEYTDKLSAAGWLLLPDAVKLTGTGNELQIRDSTATAPQRFYRVRVE